LSGVVGVRKLSTINFAKRSHFAHCWFLRVGWYWQ
jgi:hypothetical protein